METMGWLGSVLLAFCGLPQAVESYRTKNSDGLTWGFLLMWFFGEVFTFVFILPTMLLPLVFNYTANLIFLCVILYYKIRPTRNKS